MWSFRRLFIWSEPRKLRLRSFSVPRRDQMNSHKNAPLTPKGREAMVRCVEAGLSNAAAARQFNTTPKIVAKWVERFRAEGVDGLRDRSSRPLSVPSQTAPATCAVVEALRRQRHTGKQIAAEVGVSPATVSRVLRRLGLNRIRDLEPAEPVRRYERATPGEMVHIDIKKLGRFDKIGHPSPATAPVRATAVASAGSSFMSVSTITPASPSPRFCRTRKRKAPYRSSRRPWLITKASVSPSPVS